LINLKLNKNVSSLILAKITYCTGATDGFIVHGLLHAFGVQNIDATVVPGVTSQAFD
jgi:hypothetical protein